MGAAR